MTNNIDIYYAKRDNNVNDLFQEFGYESDGIDDWRTLGRKPGRAPGELGRVFNQAPWVEASFAKRTGRPKERVVARGPASSGERLEFVLGSARGFGGGSRVFARFRRCLDRFKRGLGEAPDQR